MREQCARFAASRLKDGMIVGIGAGRTMACLIDVLSMMDLDIKIVSPSSQSALLANKAGLHVLPLQVVDHIDIAFDGCDQVDQRKYALKSGGGVHTLEKLVASMAGEYILLVDSSKVVKRLDFKVPVVCEILPQASSAIYSWIESLGFACQYRTASNKDGYFCTEHGNYLLDVMVDEAQVDNVVSFHDLLLKRPGIVDISLLVDLVSDVYVANDTNICSIEEMEFDEA